MATKSNIRSIRYSAELADLIDRQVGDTFTAKFENLVTRCVRELPSKEKELEHIQQIIDRKRDELKRLTTASRQFDDMIRSLEAAKRHVAYVEQAAKSIAENCNTD